MCSASYVSLMTSNNQYNDLINYLQIKHQEKTQKMDT